MHLGLAKNQSPEPVQRRVNRSGTQPEQAYSTSAAPKTVASFRNNGLCTIVEIDSAMLLLPMLWIGLISQQHGELGVVAQPY